MSQTQDLAFFHLLARQGSLVATAREMGVTPPAVSKRLSVLEARLGTRLVNRTTRSMSLTPEGEFYFFSCCTHSCADKRSGVGAHQPTWRP